MLSSGILVAAAFAALHLSMDDGAAGCEVCHLPRGEGGPSWAADVAAAGPSAACLSCHDDAGLGARVDGRVGPAHRQGHPVAIPYESLEPLRPVAEVFAAGLALYRGAGGWTVECGSCHDPHAVDRRGLLRGPEGELCGSCHDL